MEAMGAAAAAIAQAGAVGGQGGPNNFQRFMTHHPPAFRGGGDPMMAEHWFQQVERVLEAMEITSDVTKIRLATFQLEGESQVWWDWVKASRNLEAMTWEEFRELFMGKFFLASARHAKAWEFLELKQGTMTVLEYMAKFTKLARFGDDYVASDMAKAVLTIESMSCRRSPTILPWMDNFKPPPPQHFSGSSSDVMKFLSC